MLSSEIAGFAGILIEIRQKDGVFSFERLLTGGRAIVGDAVEYQLSICLFELLIGGLAPRQHTDSAKEHFR